MELREEVPSAARHGNKMFFFRPQVGTSTPWWTRSLSRDSNLNICEVSLPPGPPPAGRDEYSLVDALKSGKITKPVVAWVSLV